VVALRHPHRLYVARDYVYVADGADGLAIIDIEKPEQPRLAQMFTADGTINDARAVQIGSIAPRCLRWWRTARTACAWCS
jgi:hypothetical protein